MSNARKLMFWLAPVCGLLLAIAPVLGQAQRVYLHPGVIPLTAAKDGPHIGVLPGKCLDREIRGAPRVKDVIEHFSDPEQIEIHKITKGPDDKEVVEIQKWSDVAGKPEAWAEFRGAQETGGVNLAVIIRNPEKGARYEVHIKKGIAAAREQEKAKLNPDLKKLLADTEEFRDKADKRQQKLAELFDERSPARMLIERHAQREIYWRLSADAKVDVAAKNESAFIRSFVEGLRSKDAAEQYLAAAACFGPFAGEGGKARLEFLKAHGLDLTEATVPNETLRKSADVLREVMTVYAEVSGYEVTHGDATKDVAELKRVYQRAQEGARLILAWDKANMPAPSRTGLLHALETQDAKPLAVSIKDNKTLTCAAVEKPLDLKEFKEKLRKADLLLDEVNTRADVDVALQELVSDLKKKSDLSEAEKRTMRAAMAARKRVDVVYKLIQDKNVSKTALAQARSRAAFEMLLTLEHLKAAGATVPKPLQAFEVSLPPAGWLAELSESSNLGMSVPKLLSLPSGLKPVQEQDFAREIAQLEQDTGLTLTLGYSADSHDRFQAQFNGSSVRLTIDDSITRAEGNAVTKPLYQQLKRLQKELGDGSDIAILSAHTEEKNVDGKMVLAHWRERADKGEFRGKQVILGWCPTSDPAEHQALARYLLDPKTGGAVSVVVTNHKIEIPEYVMAVNQIVKLPPEVRAEMSTIEMVREGYRLSAQKLKECAAEKDDDQRKAALEKEFGKELAPILQNKLDKAGGLKKILDELREEEAFFNGTARRDAGGSDRPLV